MADSIHSSDQKVIVAALQTVFSPPIPFGGEMPIGLALEDG